MKKVHFFVVFSFLAFLSIKPVCEIADDNWLLFKQVYTLIKETYVEDKQSGEIIIGALKGLAKATGPESGYISKEKYSQVENLNKMKFQLPFYITKEDGFARVISSFGGKDFGVESGDILKSVEGKSIFDLNYPETMIEIKKDKEIEMNSSFMKKGTLKVFEKKIKTGSYYSPEIVNLDENTIALQIPCLESETPVDLKESLKKFSKIIVDLRCCASDDYESALRWAGFLFGKGEVKYLVKSGEKKLEYEGEGILSKSKCYILVDSTTARGGEVLAVAGGKIFQIVGEETFGFAAKHQVLTLKNGDKLIILEGYFLDKNGEEIKDKPIKPDVLIENLTAKRDQKSYIEILNKLK